MTLIRSRRTWPFLAVALLACTVGELPPPVVPEPSDEPPADTTAGEPVDTLFGAPEVEAAAADLLASARLAYEAAELGEALSLARRVLDEYGHTQAASGAAWLAARAAFSLRRWTEARDLAAAVAQEQSGQVAEEARALAELADDELGPPSDATARLGVVLPRTGSQIMVRYADWLLEGIELALDEARQRERRPIELVVADDAGGTRTREAVAELERQNVVAVIGPLMAQQVATAAGARSEVALVTVSPTATDHPVWPGVYTVNTGDARGAQELGRYAAEVGLTQAALLYPRNAQYERKASAFAVEFEALGGEVRTAVPYDSGTTTFGTHMERILAAVAPRPYGPYPLTDSLGRLLPVAPYDSLAQVAAAQEPFALFVAAPDRDVRQIAPQVAFYGLDSAGVQVFGDEAWASAAVRRVVPRQDLQGVIAASHFPPGRADAMADPDFVRRYEQAYRRSLQNQLPALGYDAANLVLNALPNRRLTPDALARRFSLLAGLRGATGTFSVRSERVIRTPYLVVIRDGALAPAPAPYEYQLPRPKPPVASDSGGARR